MYVYLTNQSNADVYFDDLEVTVKESQVVQANYPFGLQHNTSWTRTTSLKNKHLFNAGTELNEKTQLYETSFRAYDAAIGRLTGVDPYASKYADESPYSYAGNNPIYYNDPSGGSYADLLHDDNFGSGGYWVNPGYNRDPAANLNWSDGIYRDDWSLANGSDSYRKERHISEITGGYQKGHDFYDGDGGLIFTKNGKQGKWIDYYTNGIIDADHYIDSEYVEYSDQNGGNCPDCKNGWSVRTDDINNSITLVGLPAASLQQNGYWVGRLKSGELRVYSPKFKGSPHVSKTGLLRKWGAAGLTISILVDATNIRSSSDLGSFGINTAISTGLFLAPTPYTVGYLMLDNVEAIEAAYNAAINQAAQNPTFQRGVRQAKDPSSYTGFDWSFLNFFGGN